MGTSKKRSSANDDYYTRGGYVPGIKCDGMNVLSVRECTKFLKKHAVEVTPSLVREVHSCRCCEGRRETIPF